MEKLIAILLMACLVQCEKRIVLHSATDLAQEFLKLKSEFETFKTNMSVNMVKMEGENNELRSNVSLIASKLSSVEKENIQLYSNVSTMTLKISTLEMENNQLKSKTGKFSAFSCLTSIT